jgi:cyclic pyranopterin phosphate synthase
MEKTQMIDVGKKRKTKRLARAQAFVKLNKEIIEKIKKQKLPKGNVLENARVAAIFAAKRTSTLIPLCHNIELEYVEVVFSFKEDTILVKSLIKATGKTGVEMEALVACSVAALTIYDMCKMFSKSIEIKNICLLEKRGGKSGIYIKEKTE